MQQLELFPITVRDAVSMRREEMLVQERDSEINDAWLNYENATELQGMSPNFYWHHSSSLDYIEKQCPKYFSWICNGCRV